KSKISGLGTQGQDERLAAKTPRGCFAFSKDKGKSWSPSTILSEQPAKADEGYSADMPSLAVNKDGIVAVTWYDRRRLPPAPLPRAPFYSQGCNVRIRLSLDGGETWEPSKQVNETMIKSSVWELRDMAGLECRITEGGSF